MIIIQCFASFNILPRFRRSRIAGPSGKQRGFWDASWLGISLYRFDAYMTNVIMSVARKSADEIVTLDGLDRRIEDEAHKKALEWTESHRTTEEYRRKETQRLIERNNALYGENCTLRQAFAALTATPHQPLAQGIEADRRKPEGVPCEAREPGPVGDAPESTDPGQSAAHRGG